MSRSGSLVLLSSSLFFVVSVLSTVRWSSFWCSLFLWFIVPSVTVCCTSSSVLVFSLSSSLLLLLLREHRVLPHQYVIYSSLLFSSAFFLLFRHLFCHHWLLLPFQTQFLCHSFILFCILLHVFRFPACLWCTRAHFVRSCWNTHCHEKNHRVHFVAPRATPLPSVPPWPWPRVAWLPGPAGHDTNGVVIMAAHRSLVKSTRHGPWF